MRLVFQGNELKSIRLAFEGAHVAAGSFRSSGTPLAALVGRQKVPREVTAAGGIAGVKRRAALLQRHCFRGTSVIVQRAQLGILVVEIPCTAEMACTVAAQVVAVGRDRAGTVPAVRAVRDNAVLDKNRASRVAESPAAADILGVVAKSRIADLDGSPLAVDGSSARRSGVPAEGTVRNGREGASLALFVAVVEYASGIGPSRYSSRETLRCRDRPPQQRDIRDFKAPCCHLCLSRSRLPHKLEPVSAKDSRCRIEGKAYFPP